MNYTCQSHEVHHSFMLQININVVIHQNIRLQARDLGATHLVVDV